VFSVRQEHETRALLGYYAALSGTSVPTFRDNLSSQSSRVKPSKKNACFLASCIYVALDGVLITVLERRSATGRSDVNPSH
jgi:hypothetical protein